MVKIYADYNQIDRFDRLVLTRENYAAGMIIMYKVL